MFLNAPPSLGYNTIPRSRLKPSISLQTSQDKYRKTPSNQRPTTLGNSTVTRFASAVASVQRQLLLGCRHLKRILLKLRRDSVPTLRQDFFVLNTARVTTIRCVFIAGVVALTATASSLLCTNTESIATSWLLSGSKPSAPENILRPEMATRRERKIWVLQDALPRTSSDSIVTFEQSAMQSAWPAKPLASSVPPRPPVPHPTSS